VISFSAHPKFLNVLSDGILSSATTANKGTPGNFSGTVKLIV